MQNTDMKRKGSDASEKDLKKSKDDHKPEQAKHIHNEAWHKLCDNTTIKDLLKSRHRKLVTIDKHASVRQALQVCNWRTHCRLYVFYCLTCRSWTKRTYCQPQLLTTKNALSWDSLTVSCEYSSYDSILVLDIAGFVLATWRQQSHHLDDAHFPGDKFFSSNILNVLSTVSWIKKFLPFCRFFRSWLSRVHQPKQIFDEPHWAFPKSEEFLQTSQIGSNRRRQHSDQRYQPVGRC